MKKTLALAISVMMVIMLSAGCGSPAPASNSSGTPDASKSTEAPATTEKVKLEFWTWLASDDAIAAYNASQDKVEIVKVQMSHADINAKLAIALEAGTGAPDIFQTTHRYFPQFKDGGKMYDMTADVQDVIGGFPEGLQSIVSSNGKLYGLPADISPSVMWYRKDMFDQYGIMGDTFDDITAGAKVLKEQGIYMMPIFNPAGSWGANAVGMLLGSRNANYFTEDGKVIKNNKDLEIVLTWLNDMTQNGHAESLTYFTPEFWGEFKADKLAGWIMNVSEGSNLKKNCPEQSGKWSVMPTPKWSDLDKAYSGFWGGTVVAVPEQSKYKKEAADFVKWLAGTNEGQVWAGKTWNAVPALTSAYDEPYFSEGDPFYSGECVYKMINDMPTFYYFDWAVAEKIIGEKLDIMFAGKATPIETARAIEDTVAKETGR